MLYKLLAKIVSHPAVFKRLLARAKKTPYSHIYGEDDGLLYMERYWLLNPYPESGTERKINWLPSIRIHKIVRPDPDRHLHDHPWNARTIILKGWYAECRENAVNMVRARGNTARLNFGEYHKITSVDSNGAYTLFIAGKYRGVWGFLVNGKKVDFKTHLNIKD